MKGQTKLCLIAAVSLIALGAIVAPRLISTGSHSGLVADARAANATGAANTETTPAGSKDETSLPLAPAVTVVQARQREFIESLFLSGTLVARDEVLIGSPLDGLRITELLAEDGDHVDQGQVLARLDRTQLDALLAQNDASLIRAKAAIEQARSQIDQYDAARAQANAELLRARKLDVSVITQATLDQRIAAARSTEAQFAAANSALAIAQADEASREAERRELKVRLDRTEVRAPVAGIISRRTARLGAVAMSASDPLFRLIALGAIDLDAEVPEQSMARLTLSMPAKIMLPGLDQDVEGRIRLISEEVDKTTRTGKVRVALPPDTQARIGSFATGIAIIAKRQGVEVPASAVQRTGKGDFVQVVKDDRVELRPIRSGVINERSLEVQEGLSGGESVIARAGAFLRGGDKVRPIAAAENAGSRSEEAAK